MSGEVSDEGPDTRIDRDSEAESVHCTVGFRSRKSFNIECPHSGKYLLVVTQGSVCASGRRAIAGAARPLAQRVESLWILVPWRKMQWSEKCVAIIDALGISVFVIGVLPSSSPFS